MFAFVFVFSVCATGRFRFSKLQEFVHGFTFSWRAWKLTCIQKHCNPHSEPARETGPKCVSGEACASLMGTRQVPHADHGVDAQDSPQMAALLLCSASHASTTKACTRGASFLGCLGIDYAMFTFAARLCFTATVCWPGRSVDRRCDNHNVGCWKVNNLAQHVGDN